MGVIISTHDYEAVIFDMDGVLIDSEPLWKIAMETVFSELGCKLSKNDFQRTVGLRIDEVIHYWNQNQNLGIVPKSSHPPVTGGKKATSSPSIKRCSLLTNV